ncbi:HAMP domain-containing sensor histidine kinase [Bacillus sp. REN10]|uniref:sensor histidine kinase n=1 Tax=Bacillus sp. REN10 TaxID=2782541 RepID=UPI00193B9A67|nr:HAMP domain-containing sensor histidine kinase [Bacillus sp. REN10]
MKSLRRRLIFHFSIQFITLTIAIIVIVFALLFLLLQHLADEDVKKNFPVGVLENITVETTIENNIAHIDDKWEARLKQKNMWIQIINHKGNVIGSINTPATLPEKYTVNDILQIEETKQFHEYTVLAEIDDTYKHPMIYIIGYEDQQQNRLKKLVETYSHKGLVSETNKKRIEEQLNQINGSLHIIDEKGDIIFAAGKPMKKHKYDPLDILSQKMAPGTYSTATATYSDPHSRQTWILHTPKKKEKHEKLSILEEVLVGFGLIGACFLFITLSLSFWNGFRYGRPLLLFTSWLERMKQGKYDEVLTEKERKKIFRKNGKIKIRYRLYKEVINAFYSMAEKLDLSIKERAKLEKTREEWMTGISHDLRTPLSTIQGYGHLLESGQYNWSKEELEEMGQTIREKGEYMLHLIEDFSLAFQLKNNGLQLSKETFEVNQLLETIASKFIHDRTLQEYHFHFEPLTVKAEIEVDHKWFERMMDNLISNAMKHNPNGTAITIRAFQSTNGLNIEIQDNGVGMDEETMEQLFERYYRGTNTDERTEGAGLGMSIAKQIANLHGASVEVHSEVSKGTTVAIFFPKG